MTTIQTNDKVEFINVVGKYSAYLKAKREHSNAIIFYKGSGRWIIGAYGSDFEFENFPQFIKAQSKINEIDWLKDHCITHEDIDTTTSNGASLKLNEGKLSVNLTVATLNSAGALSAEDKLKLDSLEWILI